MRESSRLARLVPLLLAFAALILRAPAVSAQNWPSFRGPAAAGVATGTPPVSWDIARSTNVAWKTGIPGLAHSSPIVWGDRQTQVKVPTPVVNGDVVIVTGGYPAGGRPIYAIKTGGRGELGPQALAWHADRGSPYTSTPLLYDGFLYICTDNGILSAYDPATGTRTYQQRVSPASGGFSASPIAAGGRIYIASEDGDVFVVRAGRTFELLSTNRMGAVVMATPAISGPMLIVRTQTQLVGIAQP